MQAGPSLAREARLRHRHVVRALSYVTLDQGNGGILLNVARSGVAVQSVAAVRMGQHVRVRFDLVSPKVLVDTRGEVSWATSSGRCGIRFLDLPAQTGRQLDEWIFTKLLEGAAPLSPPTQPIFPKAIPAKDSKSPAAGLDQRHGPIPAAHDGEDLDEQLGWDDNADPSDSCDDSLIISQSPVTVIDLPSPSAMPPMMSVPAAVEARISESGTQLDWLSQPLSGRGLVWTINALVVTAAWLLFVLIFLSVLRELPKWPGAMISGAGIIIAGLYWGFFRLFAGASLGVTLARLAEMRQDQDEAEENRFR